MGAPTAEIVASFPQGRDIYDSQLLFHLLFYALRRDTELKYDETLVSHPPLFGHRRRERGRAQGPETYEALILKGSALLDHAKPINADEKARVCALLIGFNGYHRPGGSSTARTKDLHTPVTHHTANWRLTLFPKARTLASETKLQDSTFEVGETHPQGTMLSNIAAAVHSSAQGLALLSDLTTAALDKHWEQTATASRLAVTDLCRLRHRDASIDGYNKVPTDGIQSRCFGTPRSQRPYTANQAPICENLRRSRRRNCHTSQVWD